MPPPIDPERLLAQTAWVRRLALSLARDEASAEDLVQETFVAALRRPPPNAEQDAGLRAWIAHVLRNLAFRRKRDDFRREQRERHRMHPAPSDEEARARELEELRTELFAHVVALPESARQVVLLRYFEGLESAEIARRLGVPDSTVRNRLRRALAELRERLERGHGASWRDLCLFVLPDSGAKLAAGAGAVASAASATLWWIGIPAALLLSLAWLAWRPTSTVTPEMPAMLSKTLPSMESGDRPPSTAARSAPSGAPGRLREIAAENSPPPEPSAPLVRVFGTVRDEHGQLVPDLSLTWFDERGTRRNANVSAGEFTLNGLHAGWWLVASAGSGWQCEQFDVLLGAEPAQQRHDFTVRSTHFLPVRLIERAGKPLLRAGESDPPQLADRWTVFASRTKPPTILPWLIAQDVGTYRSCARFWDRWSLQECPPNHRAPLPAGYIGLLEVYEESPFCVALADGLAVIAVQELHSLPDEVTFVLAQEEILTTLHSTYAGLRLRVLGPDGRTPLREGQVLVRSKLGQTFSLGRGNLSSGGRAELLALRPGPCLISVISKGYSRLELERELQSGKVNDLGDVTLAPEQRLQIHFVLPEDVGNFVRFQLQRELPGELLRALSSFEGRHEGRAVAGGGVEIPWPGPGTFVLRVLDVREVPPPSEAVVRDTLHVGARPMRIELGDAPGGELLIRIERTVDVSLRPPRDSSGSIRWVLGTAEGLPCQRLITEGRTPLPLELVPGDYAIARVLGETGDLGPPQVFTVGPSPLVLELRP